MQKKFFNLLVTITLLLMGASNAFSATIGNTKESPIRQTTKNTDALKVQKTFNQIYRLYEGKIAVVIKSEEYAKIGNFLLYGNQLDRLNIPQMEKIYKETGLGTGFVISENGYILTNNHVIKGAAAIKVILNNKTYNATLIGADSETDIAVLKIAPKQKLQAVYLGDSNKVQVGDWAIAIGNPFGLTRSFTVGIISATGRKEVDMMGGLNSFIQTDASINSGNSGGPLINIFGEVIGINSMIYSKTGGNLGISFAIPINTAKEVIQQLIKYKKVQHGYLGIKAGNINDYIMEYYKLSSRQGVFVAEVVPNSPADKAGIKSGDVIKSLNQKAINNYTDLITSLRNIPVNSKIKIVVKRKNKKLTFFVKISARP